MLRTLSLIAALSLTATPVLAEVAHRASPAPVAASKASYPRTVPLEGQRNFRDLGGYRTADGRHQVRWGMLYRSGSLARLTEKDYALLAPLGITSVIDFRSTAERASEPTDWRAGEPEILSKAYTSKGEAALMGAMQGPDASQAKVREAMIGFYHQMPEQYADQYSEVFHRLAAHKSPLLFHCTAGKDRTGLASALVLSVLGVPRDKVIEDYVLTEKAGDFRGAAASAPPPAGDKDPYAYMRNTKSDLIAPLMRADPAYLEAALAQITKDYGSVEAFVRKRLGVSAAELATIRARLLEPVR
jgi:protein-tyrosine phosphatase